MAPKVVQNVQSATGLCHRCRHWVIIVIKFSYLAQRGPLMARRLILAAFEVQLLSVNRRPKMSKHPNDWGLVGGFKLLQASL